MRSIHVLPVFAGAEDGHRRGSAAPDAVARVLPTLAAGLEDVFGAPCRVLPEALDGVFAEDRIRGQYHSTAILQRLAGRTAGEGARLLGVTDLDLFVPVLAFVFGEAQLQGPCAVVSFHRLREEFYGLPANESLLRERLLKEAVHELGHTFGLRHCDTWECVMSSTHSVERLDVKGHGFCAACRAAVERWRGAGADGETGGAGRG
jgi:archaemetzincin